MFKVSWLSRIFRNKKIDQKASIVILGASGAGKTTLVRYLETGEPVMQDPRTTLGIDIRQNPIDIGGWSLSAIDVGGQELYRESLWSLGVSQADAVIYVIDGTVKPTSDNIVFEESKFSFDYMLQIVDNKTPILILINKQDLTEQEPLSTQASILLYNISSLVGRSFNILPTSAKFGDGVETAILWLIDKIQEKK
ncbi:MAG: GTP-binding protein [Candidatus Heimdallarchaeota archaeon]|nr:GTP-binding protein [Candidatus Heimdallarchaeota archaeon]